MFILHSFAILYHQTKTDQKKDKNESPIHFFESAFRFFSFADSFSRNGDSQISEKKKQAAKVQTSIYKRAVSRCVSSLLVDQSVTKRTGV